MGHRLENRHQFGEVHAVIAVGLVLPHPAGRGLSEGNPPVGMRPVNQAVAFGQKVGIGKDGIKHLARFVHTHGVAVVVRAHHVFHHLPVLLLQLHEAGRTACIDIDKQMERTVGHLSHPLLHLRQVLQGKGREIVVSSQINQNRPLVGQRVGTILLVA